VSRFKMSGLTLLVATLPLAGQQTKVSQFKSTGFYAEAYPRTSSGDSFTNAGVYVTAGCPFQSQTSHTYLSYFYQYYSPGVTLDAYGDGCIPDTALVVNASGKSVTLNLDTAQLDPANFYQWSSGIFPSTVISAEWVQTGTREMFSSGITIETLNLAGALMKIQTQGKWQVDTANISLNLLGFTFTQADNSLLTFTRDVTVQITRTLKN
jgi:hypothetical protein